MQLSQFNPELLAVYHEVIIDGMNRHPRSHQKAIGPSEVGHPCDRAVALKMSNAPVWEGGDPSWQAWIGTQAHGGMEAIFEGENKLLTEDGLQKEGDERYVPEGRVVVGVYGERGIELAGSSDLFDRAEGMVVDWKFPGAKKMAKLQADPNGAIEEQYYIQAQCYGRGRENAGEEVKLVCIAYLPASSNDFKTDGIWKVAKYDRSVSEMVLQRLGRIQDALDDSAPEDDPFKPWSHWTDDELEVRAEVIQKLNVAPPSGIEAFCKWCPFYRDVKSKDFKEEYEPAYECRGYAVELRERSRGAAGGLGPERANRIPD